MGGHLVSYIAACMEEEDGGIGSCSWSLPFPPVPPFRVAFVVGGKTEEMYSNYIIYYCDVKRE